MSYWSGDLMRGTAENPLNAHIDFGGLEVRIKGGASTLFAHKTPQTVIQNLNIVDTKSANSAKLVPMNYATTGPCTHINTADPTDNHQANYVNTEQEMKDWFASYSSAANPTKTKCLNVKIPFVTTITTQLKVDDYLQSNHYDFGGATLIHQLQFLLPSATTTSPTVSNLIVRATGSSLIAGIVANAETSGNLVIENCTSILYGTMTISADRFGGITKVISTTSKVQNCKAVIDSSANITLTGGTSGGIAGIVSSGGTIDGCRVEVSSSAAYNVQNTNWGGVVGIVERGATVKNSSALVNSDTGSSVKNAGGIAGTVDAGTSGTASISNCYTEGGILIGNGKVGGIVGGIFVPVSFTNVRTYVTTVRARWYYTNGGSYYLGGFVGYIETGLTSTVSFTDCLSTTTPVSDADTYKIDGIGYYGGFVGRMGYNTSWQTFTNCYSYVSTIQMVSNKEVHGGGFAGSIIPASLSNAATNIKLTNSKFFVRQFSASAPTSAGFGRVVGIVTRAVLSATYARVTSNNTSFYTSNTSYNAGNVEGYSAYMGSFSFTSSWPTLSSFASASLVNNPTVNYLSGSSVSQVATPISGKQIKFKFTGLADYYLDNIYISMNDFATDINIGGYTQIMYNGTLLSDFSAKSIVGTVPKSHSRGDSNILAQDEFYFYYKSPNTTNNDVTVKVQLKHKTTSAKKTFMLVNSSQWFEL